MKLLPCLAYLVCTALNVIMSFNSVSSVLSLDVLKEFLFLFLSTTAIVNGYVPSATIRSAYIRISGDDDVDSRRHFDIGEGADRRNDGANRRNYGDEGNGRPYDHYQPYQPYQPYAPAHRPSYIIYDGDLTSLPGSRERPQILSSTRPWHLQFNNQRHLQPQRTLPKQSVYQSVYSNLIQVVAEPSDRRYYGPYRGNEYLESDRRRPSFYTTEVPKYEVIYPYESDRNNVYPNEKLPEKFPRPFHPNVNFEFKDPPPSTEPRPDFGLYPTETINYRSEGKDSRRNGGKDLCNYIKLNERGFPIGNELCGRSVSDIILLEEYPNDGQLVLEHRKRYRGAFTGSNPGLRQIDVKSTEVPTMNRLRRRRRSAEAAPSEFGKGYSSYPTGYGTYYRPFNGGYDSDYDTRRFISRPYQSNRERGSIGYGFRGGEGQPYDNVEAEETKNNRGLTSYMTNSGRGGQSRYSTEDNDEVNYDDENESKNSRSNNSSSSNDRKNTRGQTFNSSRRNNSNRNRDRSDSYGNRNNDDHNGRQNFNDRSWSNNNNFGSNRGSDSYDSRRGYSSERERYPYESSGSNGGYFSRDYNRGYGSGLNGGYGSSSFGSSSYNGGRGGFNEYNDGYVGNHRSRGSEGANYGSGLYSGGYGGSYGSSGFNGGGGFRSSGNNFGRGSSGFGYEY